MANHENMRNVRFELDKGAGLNTIRRKGFPPGWEHQNDESSEPPRLSDAKGRT